MSRAAALDEAEGYSVQGMLRGNVRTYRHNACVDREKYTGIGLGRGHLCQILNNATEYLRSMLSVELLHLQCHNYGSIPAFMCTVGHWAAQHIST